MKIELDLSEIFEDEDGNVISKDLVERIENAIVFKANETIQRLVINKFKDEIAEQVTASVQKILLDVAVDLLDKEFVPTSRYGDRDEPTTLRNRICRDIERAMVWSNPSSFSNDQSAYTKIVKEVVNMKLKDFAKEFNKTVDETLVAECMQYALEKIRKAAGVK